MDYIFNNEERHHQRIFRDFMDECTLKSVKKVEGGVDGYDHEIWNKMSNLQWLSIGISENHSSNSNSMVTTSILCEEMGRVLLPVPFISTVVLGGGAVFMGGSEYLQNEVIGDIIGGECIISSALMDDGHFSDIESWNCEAIIEGDSYKINGVKTFVENAHTSDYILLVAGTDEGITVFLVNRESPGIYLEPLKSMGGEKFFNIHLENVRVDQEFIIGEVNNGQEILRPIVDRARVALAAKMIGSATIALDMTIQYAKDRNQFNKPIGSFQSIAFKLSDLATKLSGARLLVYKAAWMTDRLKPECSRLAAMAKAYVSDLYRLITDVGVHTHGGYGFTLGFDIQYFFRKAKAEEMTYGDATYNRNLVYENI